MLDIIFQRYIIGELYLSGGKLKKIFDANTQLILNEIYEKVAKKLEKEFYPKWGFESEKMTSGYFRMAVLGPMAQVSVVAIIKWLFRKNAKSRRVILSEDLSQLSQKNTAWIYDFSPEELGKQAGINADEAKTVVQITTKVLLTSDLFKKPKTFVVDEIEFTVQLHR